MNAKTSPSFLKTAGHISDDISKAASAWLEQRVNQGARSVFLPAGRTPEALYNLWETERPSWLRGLIFKQIDDVMTGPKRGLFKKFFEAHLPSFGSQFEWIERADSGADVAILGLGLNGHIAFHEPHLPKNFFGGCVELSAKTCETLGVPEPTWGLTYGASTFLRCRSILMMASGASKRAVVTDLCEKSPALPATALIDHRDFTLLVDRAAAP